MQKILYIDDEEDIRTVASMALEFGGDVEVRTYGSAQEGIDAAVEWQPDLILLDVQMPVMDGRQAIEILQRDERTAAIPVVFFTASVQRHDVDGLLKLGAKAVIGKPFDPMGIRSLVAPYLQENSNLR